MIAADDRPPPTCTSCGADEMGCQVKSGLSGRRCCDACSHLTETNRTRKRQGELMDLEQHYREWWRSHTPQQRKDLQRMSGVVSPHETVELTEDVAGEPLGVETQANPDHGTVSVPVFVMSWRPEDDDPVTVTDDDES